MLVLAGAVCGCQPRPAVPVAGPPPHALNAVASRQPAGPRDPDFMPFGVYWAGEYLWQTPAGQLDWERIEASLADLAKHHCNAVWLTHRNAAETAEFARRAARHGISLIAAVAELAGEVEHIRKANHAQLIAQTLATWGDAPKPIAWGLGDEPRASYMHEMAAYVAAWHQQAPNEPVTSVVMWGDVAAAGRAGFDALCCDLYPFFSAGNPHGYGMGARDIWLSSGVNLVRQPGPGWIMGQAYQEPWGPWEADAAGNIVYLPGGAPHWVMPSPTQIRWQAWATMAIGGKGMFYFLYHCPSGGGNPGAAPCKLPAAAPARTNSGAGKALVASDGRPTPQYEALGQAFGEIRSLAAVLAPLAPVASREVWLKDPTSDVIVGLHRHPRTGQRVLVVAGPSSGEGPTTVTLVLTPHLSGLRDARSQAAVALTVAPPWREATVAVAPGGGRVFYCDVAPGGEPAFYAEDFTTDQYRRDGVATARVRLYDLGSGQVLGAADAGASFGDAHVTYDLDRLLGPLPAGGLRVLLYQSGTTTDYRGADWSVSTDGQSFAPLSRNQPGQPIVVSERFLRVGLSWRQAGSVHYGYLAGFQIIQCPRPAR